MATWTVDQPQQLTVEEAVERLDVQLVSGRINVVGGDGPPRVEVTSVGTRPLIVRAEGGELSIRYEGSGTWPLWVKWTGPFWWFMIGRRRYKADVSVVVPRDVVATVELTSGSAIVSALRAGTRVKVVSGQVTLLGLAGKTVALIFEKPSTRTRVSFEVGVRQLGGEVVMLYARDMQSSRGELVSVLDAFLPPFAGFFLYFPDRRHPPPKLRALIEHVRRFRDAG